jgi:hypothetical protein
MICCLRWQKTFVSAVNRIFLTAQNDKIFTKGRYGVVSCYNSLPLSGGGSTLVRLNLKAIAERSSSIEDFFTRQLPHYCQQQIAIIDARCDFLYSQSGFFENSFLVAEGLIDPQRFAPMFGMYGLAEAVNTSANVQGSAPATAKMKKPTRWVTESANSWRHLSLTRR